MQVCLSRKKQEGCSTSCKCSGHKSPQKAALGLGSNSRKDKEGTETTDFGLISPTPVYGKGRESKQRKRKNPLEPSSVVTSIPPQRCWTGKQMMAGNILGLVGASDLAAFLGNHQAQVHSEPAVRGSRMWPHVSSWVHDGIFDLCRKQNTLFFHLSRCGRMA